MLLLPLPKSRSLDPRNWKWPGYGSPGRRSWVPELATEDEIRAAWSRRLIIEATSHHRKDGTNRRLYFDRVAGRTLDASFVRLLPRFASAFEGSVCRYAALVFSGRDPAAGKSWEAWVRKYWEKKSTGEGEASLQPDSLEQALSPPPVFDTTLLGDAKHFIYIYLPDDKARR